MTLEMSLALLMNRDDHGFFIGPLAVADAKAFVIKLWFVMVLFTKYE